MSFWTDLRDTIEAPFQSAGEILSDAVKSVLKNPIGAITSVVAMEMGIPPAWAGALGGAAGAAATGGNVVKAAITGGAMGYMGSVAGAASGAYGPIAQAAATGAASSVTGAVLTGQDVVTALKSGLVLGTAAGGVATLMTQKEAMSSVPKDVLAKAATTSDPIGSVAEQMGWAASESAAKAADAVISQNLHTSITGLADSIPDSVLKEAAALPPGSDTNAYIADKMGWENNGITTNASSTALGDYQAANKVIHSYGPVTPESVTTTTPTVSIADTITSTGLVDAADASVLAHNGYTATDVQNLVKAGYSPADLADMASTGVPASTLTSLSNTQFTESQINDLLTNHVSANNIADASNLVNAGKITVAAADSLMKNGVNTIDLKSIANSGKADAFAKLMDNGVSRANAQFMLDRGVDLNKAASAIDSGKLTGSQLETSVNNGTYNKVISDATTVTPVQPTGGTTTTTTTAPVGPTSLDNYLEQQKFDVATGDITKAADSYGTQYEQDLANQRNANMTASQKATMEARLNNLGGNVQTWESAAAGNDYNTFLKKMGWSADNAYTREAYQRGLDSYTGQQQAQTTLQQQHDAYVQSQQPVAPVSPTIPTTEVAGPVTPPTTNLVDVGGGNYMDQQGNITDSQGNITHAAIEPSAPISTTASYTPEQEQLYNEYIKQGMSPQQAMDMLEKTTTVSDQPSTKVDVGGSAGYAGDPTKAIDQYRTPGTDLATQEQIDNGTAKYNAGANAWEVTKATEPVVPVVPPTTPEIPEVIVTAPRVETPQQPTVPIIVPPTTVAPTVQNPVAQPTAPVAPQTPPTVVDTKTEDNGNGTSTQVITYSNGSVSTNVILNGNGPSAPSTTIPEITVTAPKEPPLTPPTQVVIPEQPKIPEVVVPEEPVTPSEPTTPTEPTTPIVPIDVPLEPKVPTDNTHYGTYAWGKPPVIEKQTELNPGLINAPTFYKNTNPAQAQYYWGAHPFQPTSTFNPTLYNQIPNAPTTPWGATQAQTAATPAQILAAMQGRYPLLNTTSVTGPVRP